MHNKAVDAATMVRNIDWEPDTFGFFAKNKGKAVPVIIDYVRNGSSVAVEVCGAGMKHCFLNVTLAGIICPRTAPVKRKGEKGKEEKVSPVAAFAQYFVSKRLLKRDMNLIPLGIDKHGTHEQLP